MTRSKLPFRPRSHVLALEPRLLFDGAGAIAAIEHLDSGPPVEAPQPEAASAPEAPAAVVVDTGAPEAGVAGSEPLLPQGGEDDLALADAGGVTPVSNRGDGDDNSADASPLSDPAPPEMGTFALATGDGPPVTDPLPGAVQVGEDDEDTVVGAGITVGGTATDVLTVTASVGSGSLNDTSFTGTATEVEAWLSALTYTYTGTSETGGTDTLHLSFDNNTAGGTTLLDRDIVITPQNDAPTVSPPTGGAGQLTAAEGGSVSFAPASGDGTEGNPVTQANLGLSDPDNAPNQIIVKIADEGSPLHGTLTLNGNELAVGSTFALSDIGNLVYQHDGSQVNSGDTDRIIVTVDDGAGGLVTNQTVTIALTPVNQAPVASGSIVLIEGEQGVQLVGGIVPAVGGDRGNLTITDPDDTAHTITVAELPLHGVLLYNGVAVTAGQVINNANPALFTYDHGGSETSSDAFRITVTDAGGGTGTHATSALQTINLVVLPNNDDPTLTLNTGVSFGPDAPTTAPSNTSSVTITSAMLQVEDVDSPDTQLTYTLTSIPTGGYLTFGSTGLALPVGYSFTQADLDAGNIRFVSTNGGGHSTDFQFTVKDGDRRLLPNQRDGGIYDSDDQNASLTVNTFTINYLGTAEGDGPGIGFPPFATVIEVDGLPELTSADIAEGQEVVLTSAQLSTTDTDSTDVELVYRLLSLPTNGQILLDGSALSLLGSFTQDDVNKGLVSFRHDGGEIFTSSFTFDVSNGRTESDIATFNIDVKPQNDTPTASTGTIKLVEGGTQVINAGGDHIVLSDADNDPSDKTDGYAADNVLSFEVTALPAHGSLTLSGVAVAVGDVISQADLDAGRLAYAHNGSENFSDSFRIVPLDDQGVDTAGTGGLPISDPTNQLSRGAEQTVDIKISPLNDAPVYVGKAEPGDGNVPLLVEGGALTILGASGYTGADGSGDATAPANNIAHLVYEDTDNTSSQRQYRVTTAVGSGTLVANGRVLSVGSVFTQAELDSGAVTYLHNGADNDRLDALGQRYDYFEYVVSDGDYSANDTGWFVQGAASTPSRYTIGLAPANDAPTITSGSTTLVVDTAAGVSLPSITLTDVDLGDGVQAGETDFVQVTVAFLDGAAAYADGVLNIGTLPAGVTVIGAQGGSTLVFQGTLADVQLALNAVNVSTAAGVDADRGDLSLRVTVDDRLRDASGALTGGANGGVVNEGGAPIDAAFNTASITFGVSASNVNDLPVVSVADPLIVNEDVRTRLTGITYADPDAFDSTGNTVTLTVTNGTLDVTAGSRPSGYTGGGTSTLVLTGTKAELDAALAQLHFTSALHYNGDAQLTITVDDGDNTGVDGVDGDPADATTTVNIAILPVNDQPTITVPSGTILLTGGQYTFASGALAFDDAADISNPIPGFETGVDLYTITLSAAQGGSAYGTINVPTTTGLTVTGNNAANTDVVLTGSRADLLAALNSGITYAPTNPNANDIIAFTMAVNDHGNGGTRIGGIDDLQTATSTFNFAVSNVNEAPQINDLDGTAANRYTENGPPIVIDTDVTLSDPELDIYPGGWNNATLTIGREGGANAEDVLGVNPASAVTLSGGTSGNVLVGGTVVGSYTNTGGSLNFVFNASATPGRVHQVVQAITYSNSSDKPPASVNLAYFVNDQNSNTGGSGSAGGGQDQGTGGLLTSLAVITVGINKAVDAPVVTPSGNPPAVFSENTTTTPGGAAVAVDNSITIADLDDDNIHSATVQITTGLLPSDVLAANTAGTNITVSYDATTGTLSLTGEDSKANYESVLQSLTFANTGDNPNADNTQTSRELTYTVYDNGSDGAGAAGANPGTATRTVDVLPWNDPPALGGAGSTWTYTENGAPLVLESGITLSDVDDTQMVQATAQITAGLHPQDVLAVSAASLPAGWTQSYNATTGTLTLSGAPANSADVLSALSAVTYVNTGDDPGDATRTVSWQVTDANGGAASNGQLDSNTVTTTVNVIPVNDPPVATNDTNSVTEDDADNTASGNVKTDGAPDSDPDNAMSDVPVTSITPTTAGGTAQPVTGATTVTGRYGTLVIHPDGSYVYTLDNSNPAVNALGDGDTLDEVFSYTIRDPDGGSDDATLTITIDGHTDGPPAIVPVDQNQPGTADGVATVHESGLTSDGPAGESASVDGSITLNAPDNLSSIVIGGTSVTLADLQALAPGNTIVIDTGEGELTLTGFTPTGTGPVTSGSLTYTYTLKDDLPHTGADEVSRLDSIALTIVDDRGVSGTGDLVIQIVDDVPTANPDVNSLDKEDGTVNGTVTADDRIGADGPATAGPVTGVVAGTATGPVSAGVGAALTGTYGTITLQPDGSYTYVVDPANPDVVALAYGATLEEVFSYTITDADGDTSTTTLTITINGNLRPVAVDDAFTTDEDTPLSGSLQGNDSLGDGSAAEHTWSKDTDPANGTVVVNPDGSFVYTPNPDYHGTDSFTYTVTDRDGNTSTATVTLTINSVNDVPVAVDDRTSTRYNTPVGGSLADNDTPSGDGGNVWAVGQPPSNGTVVVNPDGSYRYTPRPGFSGTDRFTYTITDADGDTSTATMTITVGPGPVVRPPSGPSLPAAPTPAPVPFDPRPSLTPELPPLPEVLLQPRNPLEGDQAGGAYNGFARLPIPMQPVVYVTPGVNGAQAEREATDARYFSDPRATHHRGIQSVSIGAGVGMEPVVYVQQAVRASQARADWLDAVVNGRLSRLSLGSDGAIPTPEWFEPLPENIVPEMPGEQPAATNEGKSAALDAAPAPAPLERAGEPGMAPAARAGAVAAPSFSDQLRNAAGRPAAASRPSSSASTVS